VRRHRVSAEEIAASGEAGISRILARRRRNRRGEALDVYSCDPGFSRGSGETAGAASIRRGESRDESVAQKNARAATKGRAHIFSERRLRRSVRHRKNHVEEVKVAQAPEAAEKAS